MRGRGIRAKVNGRDYLAGNLAFLEENHQPATLEERSAAKSVVNKLAQEGKTPLLFLRNGKLLGVIAVADTIRETSRAAIQRFNEMGPPCGDAHRRQQSHRRGYPQELDIEQAISDVLPTQKEAHIRSLQEEGHKVAIGGGWHQRRPRLDPGLTSASPLGLAQTSPLSPPMWC